MAKWKGEEKLRKKADIVRIGLMDPIRDWEFSTEKYGEIPLTEILPDGTQLVGGYTIEELRQICMVEGIAKLLYKRVLTYNKGLSWRWCDVPENVGDTFSYIKWNCRFHAENVLEAIEELGFCVLPVVEPGTTTEVVAKEERED